MISTGCNSLDELLQGYKEELTLIYGPAASGKTTLAIQAAIKQAEKGKKVLYIDTESGFNTERIKQINPDPKILDNILLLRIKDFMEQRVNFRRLKELVEKGKISLVIIDTIGMHYRLYLQKNAYGANLCMKKQLKILNEIAKELHIPIIITNQVYSKINDSGVMPVGGDLVLNRCQTWIELRKEPRMLILKKPQPEKSMNIKIQTEGIFQIPSYNSGFRKI